MDKDRIIIKFFGIKITFSKKKKKDFKLLSNFKSRGYDTLYIPVSGIGDGIIFTAVAKAIYEQSGKKLLVSHKHNELYKNNPYIETIENFYDPILTPEDIEYINKIGMKIIYPTYWRFFKRDDKYNLKFPMQHIIAASAANANYTGKIKLKPELYLTEDEKKFGCLSENKKQIVIMSTAIDPNKQWDKWQELVDKIKDKYYVIQIGDITRDKKLEGVIDKRGQYTLRECASVLYNSDLFVGQIGGLMHLARAVNCPAVIAYSASEPYTFASYPFNKNVICTNACVKCSQPGTSPYAEYCTDNYSCIKSITVEDMLSAIEEKINQPKDISLIDSEFIEYKSAGIIDYFKRYNMKYNMETK